MLLDFRRKGDYIVEGGKIRRNLSVGRTNENIRTAKVNTVGLSGEGRMYDLYRRVQLPVPLLPQRIPGAAGGAEEGGRDRAGALLSEKAEKVINLAHFGLHKKKTNKII